MGMIITLFRLPTNLDFTALEAENGTFREHVLLAEMVSMRVLIGSPILLQRSKLPLAKHVKSELKHIVKSRLNTQRFLKELVLING
jgi:hypothetical protein